MNTFKFYGLIAVAAVTLVGCGGAATPAAPVGKPAAPANNAAPVPQSPIGTANNPALLATLDNMAAVKLPFRYESSTTTKGNFGGGQNQQGTPQAPQGDRTSKTVGEVNGANAHVTTQINIAGGAGGVNPGSELIIVGGKSFVKGPNLNLGAIEAKWYELPSDRAQRNPIDTLLSRDGKRLLEPGDFKKGASETLEGKRCDIYEADAAALQRIYESAQTGFGQGGFGGPQGGPGGAPQAGAGQGQAGGQGQGPNGGRNQVSVKSGSYKVWACEDNVMRKYESNFSLASAQRADQVIEIQTNARLYDFGAAVTVAAPAGATLAEAPIRPNNPNNQNNQNGTPRAPGTPRATPRP